MIRITTIMLTVLFTTFCSGQPARQVELKTYLYRLTAVDPQMLVKGLTPEQSKVLKSHSDYLADLTNKGTVLFVGRTQNVDERVFGIVIFKAENDEAARKIMENDPGIKGGNQRGGTVSLQSSL